MANQSRRRAPQNMTRRERRAAGVQTYSRPTASGTLRRSYMVEPAPVDYTQEYRFVRNDLKRILLWATVLIGIMILAAVLNVPALFT